MGSRSAVCDFLIIISYFVNAVARVLLAALIVWYCTSKKAAAALLD